MAANKRRGSGRTTPKGTKNPEKKSKARRDDLPEQASKPPHELLGKAAKQRDWTARPITHNRGNR